ESWRYHATEDYHFVCRGVVNSGVKFPSLRMVSGRRSNLSPLWRASETIRVCKNPSISEHSVVLVDAAEDCQAVTDRIVSCTVGASRGREHASRRKLRPRRRSSLSVGIREHPGVIERTPKVFAPKDYQRIVCRVIGDASGNRSRPRSNPSNIELGPSGCP